MRKPPDDILRKNHVLVESGYDSVFSSCARLLQSKWRQEHGYSPEGLGNYVPLIEAKRDKVNFLTPEIYDLVEDEVKNHPEKLIKQPRIWNNLLSSQPLAFNLFGMLKLEKDHVLATAVFRRLYPEKIKQVTGIEFEYSPQRGSSKYTNDGSAFDVFIEYSSFDEEFCFLGIEVKYVEQMTDKPAGVRKEYELTAGAMGVFDAAKMKELKETSIQQLWRDHLLAGSMFKRTNDYSRGDFMVLYPSGNKNCSNRIEAYRKTLIKKDSYFMELHIEKFHEALAEESSAHWVRDFYDRYLDFSKIGQ